MFDSLKCHMPLPVHGEVEKLGVNWNDCVFQTKDLDNILGYYEIKSDGRLQYLKNCLGWAEGDQVEPNDHNGEDETSGQTKDEQWCDVDFHGRIRFYTGYCDNDEYKWDHSKEADQLSWAEIMEIEGYDWWIEFEATFDNGRCREIRMLEPEKTAVRARLASSKEWAMRRDQENSKLAARAAKAMRKIPGWREGVRAVIKAENFAHGVVSRFLYRIS